MNDSTRSGRPRWLWILAGTLVVLVAAGGFATWYYVFRDDAPEATSIEQAARSVEPDGGNGSSSSSLDGTWSVDKTVGSFSDFSSAWAGYRVREELAGIGAKTAVGRTPNVTGSLVIVGTSATKVDVTVDMTTLKSDDSQRDDQMRSQALETRRFPQATFSLTQPVDFGSVSAEGQSVSVRATGNLTLHGQTRSLTIPLDAKRVGQTIVVTGQIEIAFADYGIAKPTSFKVLSVEDKGIIELQLFFSKS